jgi:hypothetical protein
LLGILSLNLRPDEVSFVPDAITFFKSKGFFEQEGSELETHYVEQFMKLHPNSTEKFKEGSGKYYVDIIRRVVTLLRITGDHHSHEIASDVHTFSSDQFPDYDSDNVIFLKHPEIKVQRHQLSRLCSLHAPAVMHFYLSSIQSGQRVNMLNIVGFVRDKFTTKQLKNHLIDNHGGSSVHLLYTLTKANSTPCPIDQIKTNFQLYGPGLVSLFAIYDDFCKTDQFHYHGIPTGTFHGHHAMVLVGYKVVDGQDFFLLQNWWKEKQYVEVSSSYLIASQAIVHFVQENVEPLQQNDFPTLDGSYEYFEAETIDMAETFMPEWSLI